MRASRCPRQGSERLILVDGYRRILALRRLGRDTACVQSWACDLAQALLRLLAQASARPFAALEEALLLRELVHGQGLSEREVARRSGRDVSWVSRRLELVCGLSEPVLAAVRKGELCHLGGHAGAGPVGARQPRACGAAARCAGFNAPVQSGTACLVPALPEQPAWRARANGLPPALVHPEPARAR
ncbi:MAG: hypothetical protein MZV65_42595 [Chromatiales bacterium]|nr:hypothetical protein [Chromatiales bacterium]